MFFGKPRSKYGEFVDQELGYGGQERISEKSGISRVTVSKACTDPDYKPSKSTMKLLLLAIRELTGKNKSKSDFWL